MPGALRWWSGQEWTSYTAPAAGMAMPPHRPTDGYAIASVITSACGVGPVGVVLGFVARRRIKRSAGARDGAGMANAGIAIGALFTAVAAIVVVLAVNGVFSEVNADDYSGEQARVARTIDSFERAYEDADGVRMCDELFTEALTSSYGGFSACEDTWDADGEDGYAEFDIGSLTVHADGTATAEAREEAADEDWSFTLERQANGDWRIDGVEW